MAINSGFRSDASGPLVYLDWYHALIHKGELFEANDTDTSVDIAGPKYWHFKTNANGNVTIHFDFEIGCDGGALIELFESPTLSGNGTGLTIDNHNRNSSKSIDNYITAYYDPGVSDDGHRLKVYVIGTGGFLGNPGKVQSKEFIFKNSVSYLIKVTVRQNGSEVDMNTTMYAYNYTDLIS